MPKEDFRWTMPKESDGKDNVSQSGDTRPPWHYHPILPPPLYFIFPALSVENGAMWPPAPRGQGFQGFRGDMKHSSWLLPEPTSETNLAGFAHIPEKCVCNMIAFYEHSQPWPCVLIEACTHTLTLRMCQKFAHITHSLKCKYSHKHARSRKKLS